MGFLFWLLWFFNLVVATLMVIGKSFRRSFTATDLNLWFTILVFGALIGSLLLRLVLKRYGVSLGIIALPALVLSGWYLFEKITESGNEG